MRLLCRIQECAIYGSSRLREKFGKQCRDMFTIEHVSQRIGLTLYPETVIKLNIPLEKAGCRLAGVENNLSGITVAKVE